MKSNFIVIGLLVFFNFAKVYSQDRPATVNHNAYSQLGISLDQSYPVKQSLNREDFNIKMKGVTLDKFCSSIGKALDMNIKYGKKVKKLISSITVNENIKASSRADLERKFLLILSHHELTIVPEDSTFSWYKLIPTSSAIKSQSRVEYSKDKDVTPLGANYITKVIPINNVPISNLSSILKGIVNSKEIYLGSYSSSNTMIASGPASMVNKVETVIKTIDRTGYVIKTRRLQYISANDLAASIKNISRHFSRNAKLKVTIFAHNPTNHILYITNPDTSTTIDSIISELDVEQDNASSNFSIYHLKNIKSEGAIKSIKPLLVSLNGGKSKSIQKTVLSSHPESNSIIITGTNTNRKSIVSLLKKLDNKSIQIHLDILVVEVETTNITAKDLSLLNSTLEAGKPPPNFSFTTDVVTDGTSKLKSSLTQAYADQPLASAFAQSMPLGGIAFATSIGDWTALFRVLTTSSSTNILTTPSVTLSDNTEATFQVVKEVSIKTGTTSDGSNPNSVATSYARKEFGNKIKVHAQITDAGKVKITLDQEASTILKETSASGEAEVGKRVVKNIFETSSGAIRVVAGILIDSDKLQSQKIPILGDIPVVGDLLFSSTSKTTDKTNMMLFVKPTILYDSVDLNNFTSKKYNYIRKIIKKNSMNDFFYYTGISDYGNVSKLENNTLDIDTVDKVLNEED